MKKTFTKLATAVFCLLLCMQTQAQTFGIAQTPNGTGATYSTKEINVETSPNATYTVYATYPTDTTAYSHIRWYVYGGIEKVSESATHLTFRSASGTTYNDKYSKYAYGQVQLSATLSDQTVADCECATMCNPTRTANLFVYKRFDFSANHIIGPDCVLPGDSVTFSVEPWLTLYPTLQLDTAAYFWDIPIALQASPLYYSSDKSSVTFVVSDSIENKIIKCSIGRLNYADGQLPIEKPLSNDVADPIITLAGVPFDPETHSVCLPFGVDSVDLVVTNASPELEYSWNLRAWDYSYRKLTSNGSALRILPTDNMVSIKLSVQNGCSDKEYYYDINRSLSSANAIYLNDTTEHSLCLAPNSNVTLSISGVDAVTTFDWHFAANASQDWQVLKNGTSRGTIRTGSTSTTLYVSTTVCGSDSISMPIDVKPITPTINYSGNTCLSNSTNILPMSVIPVANADYYHWIVPDGWNLLAQGADSTSVMIITDGHGGDVKVCAVGCSESAYTSLSFSVQYAEPTVEVNGCINLDGMTQTNLILEVTNDTTIRYDWNIPSNIGTIISDDEHSFRIAIETEPLEMDSTYTLSVTPQNSCGSGSTHEFTLDTSPSFDFYAQYFDGFGMTALILSLPEDMRVTSYTVYYYTTYYTFLQSSNTTSSSNFVNLGAIVNQYANQSKGKVVFTTTEGCRYIMYCEWNFSGNNKSLRLNSINREKNISISPNPATDKVIITIDEEIESGLLTIYDSNGTIMSSQKVESRENSISTSNLPQGTYIFSVMTDGKLSNFKQIIKR